VQIFNDWVIEQSEKEVPAAPKESPASKTNSTQQIKLEDAQQRAQEKLRAQAEAEALARAVRNDAIIKEKEENERLASQLESMEHDQDLLEGLDQLAKMEKNDLDEKKKIFTPRVQGGDQGQGGEQKEEEKKNEEEAGWDYTGIAIVGAALVVAGISYFGRKAMNK